MGVQTSILAAGQPVGFAGMSTSKTDSISANNAEASTNIGFGLGVKPGTTSRAALLPTASGSVLLGVVLNNMTYSPGDFGSIDQDGTPPGLIPDTLMEVIRQGRVFVVVDADAAVTPNVTRLFWRFESDGASNTLVGTFRHVDDTHVVDTRGQVLAVGPIFTAADGTTKICEVYIDAVNSPT